MGLLKIKNLSLTLGESKILNDVSMNINEGKVYAIVGANGAGKSTLAAVLMGRHGYQDFEGDIIFRNESLKSLPLDKRAKKGITLGWQEPARFEGLKVKDFLKASDKKLTTDDMQELMESVGLISENYINRTVDKSLSGGERKKLELASILAMAPKLVLLDEPDSGIDVSSLENIFKAIKKLKKQGATIILITHSPTVLKEAEQAFLLCNGQIIDEGKTEDILPYFQEKCIPCKNQDAYELKKSGGKSGK